MRRGERGKVENCEVRGREGWIGVEHETRGSSGMNRSTSEIFLGCDRGHDEVQDLLPHTSSCCALVMPPETRLAAWCAVSALLGLALLTGCGAKPFSWKEEVQLHDGQVLTVRRTIQFKEYQPAGGGGGADTPESTLEVIAPQRPDTPQRWSQPPLLPMIFDRDDETKEWFVVATFYMCTAWYDLGRPKLPYAEFRFRGGQWVQQPLSAKFVGLEANMLVPNQGDVDRDHTLASKSGLMNDPANSLRHRRVVSSWKTNC